MQIYQLKITLSNSKTAFNRVFWVKETTTFSDLFEIIFVLLDWKGFLEHKFTFELDQIETKLMIIDEEADESIGCYEGDFLVASAIKLNKIFGSQTNKINFVYNLNAGLVFDIVLENTHTQKPIYDYPVCISGDLCAPPERISSNKLYINLVSYFSNKSKFINEINKLNMVHESTFELHFFDIKSINKELKNLILE